ncbi:MAG: SMI1/KNR4 family protein [Thainema sp.]
MDSLKQSLARILNIWQEDREDLIPHLQPGLSTEEIQEQISKFSLQLPEEVYELYRWRNGVNQLKAFGANTDFLPGGLIFLSLEEALQAYQHIDEYRQLVISIDEKDENACRPWFPLFGSDGSYLVVFGDVAPQETSPIFDLYIEGGSPISLKYQNLTELMSITAECYETGAYYFETEVVDNFGTVIEYLVADEQEVAQIRRCHNLKKLGIQLKDQIM